MKRRAILVVVVLFVGVCGALLAVGPWVRARARTAGASFGALPTISVVRPRLSGVRLEGVRVEIPELAPFEIVIDADPSPAMLDKAQGPRVLADEEILPFKPRSLDLVVSGLSLQHVNDLPGTLVQIERTLKPDGLFMAAMLGGETLKELRQSFVLAETEILGGASPRVAPFADVRDLGSLLQRAGFSLPVTDSDLVETGYANALELMRDLRAMGASNVVLERSRTPLSRRVLVRAAEIYAEQFSRPDGRIKATFEILTMTGWSPHASQQKPLRPGSAKARLADALNVPEVPGGDKPSGR